jgi:hypothetical protein
MTKIYVKDVQARVRNILQIEVPKELHRLREFFAMSSDETVANVRKATKAPEQGIGKSFYIPSMPKASAGLTDAQRGAAEMQWAKDHGFAQGLPPMSSVGGGNPDRTMRN